MAMLGVFEDEVTFDDDRLTAYLYETDEMDKLAGLYTENRNITDCITINYYAEYNVATDSFEIEVCVTSDIDDEQIQRMFPEVADNLINYYLNNHFSYTPVETIPSKVKEELFTEFKKYCCADFGVDSFDAVVDSVIEDAMKEG